MPTVAQQLKAAYDRMDDLKAQLADAERRQARELREARSRNDAAQHLTSREHLMALDERGREYQARADDTLAPWGIRAPARTDGEPLGDYRRRLVHRVQKRLPESDPWYGKDLGYLEGDAFTNVENQIYASGKQAAFRPDSAPPGGMRMVHKSLMNHAHGTVVPAIEFVGLRSFVHDFATPGRRVRIRNPDRDREWFRR
jgi:hypothetical protein